MDTPTFGANEILESAASFDDSSWRFALVELAPGQTAWHPGSSKHHLAGPGRVLYQIHPSSVEAVLLDVDKMPSSEALAGLTVQRKPDELAAVLLAELDEVETWWETVTEAEDATHGISDKDSARYYDTLAELAPQLAESLRYHSRKG